MLRKFLATVIIVVSLEAQVEKFQVVANNVDSENNIVIAKGNVVVFSPTYYITAQKVIYDKKNGTFELFDDVLILKNNNVQTKSEYAFLDVNTDDLYQKPNLFFQEEESIWMNSKESEKKNNIVTLGSSILSSCDCVDPDWNIRMSSAEFDTEDQWINAYNTRLYLNDFPVLYTPYFGFSTNTKRRTGLLLPTFGLSGDEGFSYTQPIFIAPADNYDIELIPMFKAKRGEGMYAYVRYADSIDSVLRLSAGYFKEQQSYQDEFDVDGEHYGFGLDYERYNILTKKNSDNKDGLFVSINYLNDIDYNTLADQRYDENDDQYIESKINYVYDTPNYMLGSYFRYYIDTDSDLDSNSETMQELPKIQAHTYSRSLFLDRLVYSTDTQVTNHYREDGVTATQYSVNVPISYSVPLYDDYLTLIAKQEFSLNRYEYGNSDINYDDATYLEGTTSIGVVSDLIKPYENYIHTMNLGAEYNHVREHKNDGDFYDSSDPELKYLSPFPISKSGSTINFGINQSLYDRENLKQIVNHKLKQAVLYDDFDNATFEDMENEITYNYILGSIKNKLVYNHQIDKLTETSSTFSLSYENFSMKLGHYMSKEYERDNDNITLSEELESYQIDLKYKLSDKYRIGYSTDYNVEEKLRSSQAFTFGIIDQCWNLDIKFEKEIEASSGEDPIKQDIVYLQLFLKPLGGIVHEYERDRTKENTD